MNLMPFQPTGPISGSNMFTGFNFQSGSFQSMAITASCNAFSLFSKGELLLFLQLAFQSEVMFLEPSGIRHKE